MKFPFKRNIFQRLSLKETFTKFKTDPAFRKRSAILAGIGLLSIPFAAMVLALAVYLGLLAGFWGGLPSRADLAAIDHHESSEIFASGGELLGKYFIYDRTNVNLEQISPHVIDCLIATEDIRFYNHSGLDYRSMGRVFVKTLLMRQSSAGGGSTISQQLAKNLYPRNNNKPFSLLTSKIREISIARRIEKVYTKDQVLLLYLNTVPFGENVFGISAASQRFFNKNPKNLTIEEAAVLIGMLKATTFFNPRHHAERATVRRNTVIGQLAKYGYITHEKADSLRKLPLTINYNPMTHNLGIAPYFREMARRQLVQILRDYNQIHETDHNLYTDGLRIHTTIDFALQNTAERAIRKQMPMLQKRMDLHFSNASMDRAMPFFQTLVERSPRYRQLQKQKLSKEEITRNFSAPVAMEMFSWEESVLREITPLDSIFKSQQILHPGLVSIDPENGHIKAWVGGNDIRFFQFDNVLSHRQAGSAFKPFLYAAALKKGIEPCEFVSNEIRVYEDFEDWTPTNSGGIHDGFYSMKGALAHSSNTIAAHYIMQTGTGPVIDMARNAGIHTPIPALPSLALGTLNTRLLDITAAYAVFLNGGYSISPQWLLKIEDKDGNLIYEAGENISSTRAMDEATSLLMQDMLQAVVDSGTAIGLKGRFGLQASLAGKTGTTQNNADAWFIGFSPHLITGVWTGIENPVFAQFYRPPFSSSSSAVPIWGEYASQAMRNRHTRPYFSGSFKELPDSLKVMVNCPLYLDELPPERWIDRIFGPRDDSQRRRREEEPRRLRRFLRDLFSRD